MNPRDLVQSAGDPDDATWVEDVADEVLRNPSASESFLQQVLSPATKLSRDFRSSLRELVQDHQDPNIREISEALGYLVAWPPGIPIRIGDIGTFGSGASFTALTQLGAFGVTAPATESAAPDGFEYASPQQVVVSDQESGRMRIGFGRKDAIFFRATGTRVHRVENSAELARSVSALYREGKWAEEWSVVTEIVEADQLLLLVAAESDAFVELAGQVASPSRALAPADLSTLSSQAGMKLTFVGGSGAVALFRAVRIQGSMFSVGEFAEQLISVDTHSRR